MDMTGFRNNIIVFGMTLFPLVAMSQSEMPDSIANPSHQSRRGRLLGDATMKSGFIDKKEGMIKNYFGEWGIFIKFAEIEPIILKNSVECRRYLIFLEYLSPPDRVHEIQAVMPHSP